MHVTTDQIFSTLSSYMGSSYINQFNKFGRTFQVYAQGDAQFRLTPRDIERLTVRNSQGDMVEETEAKLNEPKAKYPMPKFYEDFFGAALPPLLHDQLFQLHAARIGDYSIRNCG